MKHNFKFYAAMACSAIALASCSSEVIEDAKTAGKKQMTFTAQQETNVSSRTSLGNDLSVLWADNDAISIFDTDNNAFEISNGAGSSTAEFSGTAGTADTYYAVYPYQSGATISGNVISNVVIPAEQKATINTFDPKANIMTAVSNSANNLAFKNVCSYAKITTTADCKKITFTAGAEDKIAGTFNMTVGADGIATATATSGVNAATLVPSSGETFAAGTYYIAINAGNMSALKVECEYTDKTVYQSINATISIFTRSSIIDLGSIEDWPEDTPYKAVDLGLSVKWANMNVGATSPEEYGDYFAWGETEPYYTEGHAYDNPCSNWKQGKNGYTSNSYFDNGFTIYSIGGQEELTVENDAAYVNWGSQWRMPSRNEQEELINNCYWITTSDYNNTGVAGFIVYKSKSESDKGKKIFSTNVPSSEYSLSDTHIFFPFSGYRNNTDLFVSTGRYWSRTLGDWTELYSYYIYMSDKSLNCGYNGIFRMSGATIRPIYYE